MPFHKRGPILFSEAEFYGRIILKRVGNIGRKAKKCRQIILQACFKGNTVRKMDLILRSTERMLKMQFSMARKFTLQPLRRYDVKPPEKTEQAYSYVWRDVPTYAGFEPGSSGPHANALPIRHNNTCTGIQVIGLYTCFSSNFTTSVIFHIIRSTAKILKFDVNLSFIKRDDFFRANMNHFTFYTEHAGEA